MPASKPGKAAQIVADKERAKVIHADAREALRTLDAESLDSCVCDPPYALVSIAKRFGSPNAAPAKGDVYRRASAGFMGKQWDTGETAFDPEFWAQVWRVLKPGAHLLAFGGTRTYHRLACAIEDAGFEIRDQIAWLYGSGFPKSHDVSKAIDRTVGAKRQKIRVNAGAPAYQKGIGNRRPWMDDPDHMRDGPTPASAQAAQWEGWGTALKPALEPIVVARKPLRGTVANNVLTHGTGALNIDSCRIAAGDHIGKRRKNVSFGGYKGKIYGVGGAHEYSPSIHGRWPANVIHDGSQEVLSHFPQTQSGALPAATPQGRQARVYGARKAAPGKRDRAANSGSAARFFYSPKADASERMGSLHPTVKPIALMAYLVRLVTPPGGVVLDPFAGSGSTGVACLREGFRCVLIEREAEYVADIRRRLAHVRGEDAPLFAGPSP